ncbi:ABC transporter ATP-binding protein [Secundilactobacillus folii]|uniref:ATP-binding cassette domain-containing protein n=1 Tax=Secundilactobacillus folii TaxID=2678357 RepID=A0A7X2XX36_9LACO|nr:ABC transporter ATP-binding protein [Secundilactobacillus folii]MTV83199.1 ATP-binding cassette domain-containing protein [Secundilactobacillus folii]
MLKIEHLSKQFGDLKALNDVTYNVKEGEIMGLIGQNGAGKSTTFHSILSFIHYDGEISWQDQPINEKVFNDIGYLPEERSLMPKMTVEQQILYLARLKGQSAKQIKPEIDRWMNRFEVKGRKTDKIKALSKGNQQKVQLICTLIHQPKLIILDEPFSGLDPVNVDILEQAILNAKHDGAAIIFSSHDMGNVEALCDELVMMRRGEVVLHGGIRDIRDEFGKDEVFVTTDWARTDLAALPHVIEVVERSRNRYLLRLDEPTAGKDIFQRLSHGEYIEEFSQQPPTLEEIFRLKAGDLK